MNKLLFLALASLVFCVNYSVADTFQIDLSPAAGTALNLGATTYLGDHAVGAAAANETDQPASQATGNEVGAGISYNDITNVLFFDIGYGSAFGFVDLLGSFSAAHFHNPGPVNFPAVNSTGGVIHNLAGFHTASTTQSGRITGSVMLSAGQEIDLFDNEIYLNIHSDDFPNGEIRAQLIPVPEPCGIALLLTSAFGLLGSRRRRRN